MSHKANPRDQAGGTKKDNRSLNCYKLGYMMRLRSYVWHIQIDCQVCVRNKYNDRALFLAYTGRPALLYPTENQNKQDNSRELMGTRAHSTCVTLNILKNCCV